MGQFDSNNRWVRTQDITPAASAARNASGSGSAVELGDLGTARLTLAITARSGTAPSLHVLVETSDDGSTWRPLGAFQAVNDATGSQTQSFPGVGRYLRARWLIRGSSPSFTFSVSGDAVG